MHTAALVRPNQTGALYLFEMANITANNTLHLGFGIGKSFILRQLAKRSNPSSVDALQDASLSQTPPPLKLDYTNQTDLDSTDAPDLANHSVSFRAMMHPTAVYISRCHCEQ